VNKEPAFPAYFLPFPPEGHQVDLLSEYTCTEVTVEPAKWPECHKRIHGVDNGIARFYCVNEDHALYWEEVNSFDCRSCPIRCGREDDV